MKIIYAIGGGEVKEKTTLKLDEYIVNKAKELTGKERPYVLFVPTASHDCLPYNNSFHRLYTGVLNCKQDLVMTIQGNMKWEKIVEKFHKADIIYVGGGDTIFMMEHFKTSGLLDLIKDAYDRGVIMCGLSAGAICWFTDIYSDSVKDNNNLPYGMAKGLGFVNGICTPHYNERVEDFDNMVLKNHIQNAIAIENDSMIEIIDGAVTKSFSSNGRNSYYVSDEKGVIKKEIITPCENL